MAAAYIVDTGLGCAAFRTRAGAERAAAAFRQHMKDNGAYDDEYEVEVFGVREGQPFGSDCSMSDEAQKVLMAKPKPLPPGVQVALDGVVAREGSLQFRNATTRGGIVFERDGDGYRRYEGRRVTREEMLEEITGGLRSGSGWSLVVGSCDPRELASIEIAPRPAPAFRDALIAP